jgi:hypothetical protein
MPCAVLAVYTTFFAFLTLTGQRRHLRTLDPWSLYSNGNSVVYQDLVFALEDYSKEQAESRGIKVRLRVTRLLVKARHYSDSACAFPELVFSAGDKPCGDHAYGRTRPGS